MRSIGGALGAAMGLTLLSFGSAAFAQSFGTTVTPGGTNVTPVNTTGLPGAGAVLKGTISGTYASASFGTNISGTYVSEVYQETGGTYDFYYQFTNDATGSSPVTQFGASNFASAISAVGYSTTAIDGSTTSSATVPGSAFETAGAGGTLDSIVFDFSNQPGNGLPTGATSAVLFVSTNATSFTTSNGTFSGAAVANGNHGVYAPIAGAIAAPEPTSLALIIPGVLGVVGLVRRRKSA